MSNKGVVTKGMKKMKSEQEIQIEINHV